MIRTSFPCRLSHRAVSVGTISWGIRVWRCERGRLARSFAPDCAPNAVQQPPSTPSRPWRQWASPDCSWSCCAPAKYAECSPTSFAVHSPSLREGVPSRRPASLLINERGSVTAEFALALPAVALVLVCCLSGVQLAGLQVRLQDAAAASARSLARDESPGTVAATASALVASAQLSSYQRDNLVCATVRAPARNALLGLLPITLSASSCALAGGK